MDLIDHFFSARRYAVAGASTQTSKYGYRVFRALVDSGRSTDPLNPHAAEIDGIKAYPSISALPDVPESVSIVTPPMVTRRIVDDAIRAGVQSLWMQPGAEEKEASQRARDAGIHVIDDGSCILVLLSRYKHQS
ncbi:MAG: CoA-binding protein [Planctomycetota bacterium]